MQNLICMHWYVTGRVQGVWFRASTQEKATELGLQGWVRNLPDGRVEVLACGERAKLTELHNWLKLGPKLARVEELSIEELPWQSYQRFEKL